MKHFIAAQMTLIFVVPFVYVCVFCTFSLKIKCMSILLQKM